MIGMVKVTARDREDPRQLVRRFKRACENAGVVREMKRKAYYEKPSDKNRRERVRRRREAAKKVLEAQDQNKSVRRK
jgi:small subunit ribosomal protein S21